MENEQPRKRGEFAQARVDIDDLMARVTALENRGHEVASPPPLPDLSRFEAIQKGLQSRPDTPEGGYEYGPGEKKIPDKFSAHMNEGESLAAAQQRLLRDWWSELGRLRNLRGTLEENLAREQEIEDLIGIAAQLGELS